MSDSERIGTTKCDHCGNVRPYYMVTVQRDGQALCSMCVNEINAAIRERARLERQNAPRCDVPSCNRRGTWNCNGTLICGTHKKRAENNVARAFGGIGIPFTVTSRDAILSLAQK